MGKTSIEWTDATWNPVTGCSKISPGCKNCYAERMAERLKAMGQKNYANGFELTLQPHMLDLPLHWKRPRMIFVNSMSDLFHKDVPFKYIDQVFTAMVAADWHTYQILTKRADRMHEYFRSGRHDNGNGPDRADYHLDGKIWLGVSVEDFPTWDARVHYLKDTPAAVRFISYEPALADLGSVDLEGIDWLIAGGESGPGARPMHPDWARSIRDQCQAAGVAFHFKQWGEWTPHMHRVGKKAAGRLLDGCEWNEFPMCQL